MNPEIQKELLSWLQGLRQTVQSGYALAKDQVPQILWEKVIVDRIFYTALEGALLIYMLFAAFYFLPKMWRLAAKNNFDYEPGTIFLSLSHVIPLVMFMTNFYNFVTVWFAPRLYLINWLKDLLTTAAQ